MTFELKNGKNHNQKMFDCIGHNHFLFVCLFDLAYLKMSKQQTFQFMECLRIHVHGHQDDKALFYLVNQVHKRKRAKETARARV